ncbi:MAG: AlpA family phage regulatory protein [Candidatus Thioglobus sp.]|jgi:predicted DNA-binding transcriptional regulator AlpA
MQNNNSKYLAPEEDVRFMRMKQLTRYTSLSRAYLYNLIKEDDFPSSVSLNGIRMWNRSDIVDWFNKKTNGGI